MINLLPPEDKKYLLLEKNKKLLIVLGNVFLISLVSLLLLLSALKFYMLGDIDSKKYILDNSEKGYQTPDFESLAQLIIKHNADLAKVDNFYKKEIYFNDILKTIFEIKKPVGLYFKSISIDKMKENNLPQQAGKVKVTISGFSDTRDNLLIFRDNINSNKKIENAYFPPDSWIKSKDITFYLTFQMNPIK